MNNKRKFSTLKLAIIGLMAAMVLVATRFRIDIPTPLGKTGLHIGNVMCVLSGLLFGPLVGGLSAGFGSAIYDLFDPTFAPEFWITFILKFVMGYLAGYISHLNGRNGEDKKTNTIAAIVGALSYVVLYIGKNFIMNYFIIGNQLDAVIAVTITKGVTSLANAVIAVVASLALAFSIRPALKSAGVFSKLER